MLELFYKDNTCYILKSMNFTLTEVALISIQVLLIPFARYIFESQKKEIMNNLLTVLNEHYLGLENLIDRNKASIEKLSSKLAHRAEIVNIKNKIIEARVSDVESFLQKSNDFQARCRYPIDEFEDTNI